MKKNSDGQIEKYKARLVAKGFAQVEGIDYFETFALVAKLASIQSILAIASRNDWPINMFDFHSAFLNGELGDDEEVFMEQPLGYEKRDRKCFCVQLFKSIHGLKQAGRKWYGWVTSAFTDRKQTLPFSIPIKTDIFSSSPFMSTTVRSPAICRNTSTNAKTQSKLDFPSRTLEQRRGCWASRSLEIGKPERLGCPSNRISNRSSNDSTSQN